MNTGLGTLHPYPFEKLTQLFNGVVTDGSRVIPLTIGEPQHPPPEAVLSLLAENSHLVAHYPATAGRSALRASIAKWLVRRFELPAIDPERHVLPLNGTREGLFAIAQTAVSGGAPGAVVCPNPFYQIYEGAALLAGTEPVLVNCIDDTGFLPNFDDVTEDAWQACELLFICTPGNPAGAVMPLSMLQRLIELAHQHDFLIASDECYSEIFPEEDRPPPGLLQASAALGHEDFSRCLCFHSLSKRSNLPGLRSGFVAGDPHWIERFRRYRTYHGCAMPLHHQLASEWAWADEQHVIENRARYREKFAAVTPILASSMNVSSPDAGFYLWPETPIDDEAFAQQLLQRSAVKVLPGRYLARETHLGNPGENRVRLALVAELRDCVEAAERVAHAGKLGW